MAKPIAATLSVPFVHVVYTCRDEYGKIIYIGSTSRLRSRLREHEKTKPWWSEVAGVSVRHFKNRADARAAEALAICGKNPRYNQLRLRQRSSTRVGQIAGS